MHPFPSADRLPFLLEGSPRLDGITVAPYVLNLQLDNGCSLTCEWKLTYVDQAGTESIYEREWRNEAPIHFHHLLEQRLILLDREDYALTLRFAGGGMLIIHSYNGPYECGQIYGPDESPFIVF
jgi:hypothetical protein